MLCAPTARRLKPGTFERFREVFLRHETLENPPEGYMRFNMIRNTENPDEAVCFGSSTAPSTSCAEPQPSRATPSNSRRIAPFVDSVGADGLYEIVEEWTAPPRAVGLTA